MSREEARLDAAIAKFRFAMSTGAGWENALANSMDAVTAHDAANGIHRISLDDATVERAARALFSIVNPLASWDRIGGAARDAYRRQARAVLAAAVQEESAKDFPNDGHTFWCKGAGHEGPCRRGVLTGTERPE